ncbi:MAG: helix-turn-helix domain-containing protein [Oscillospiraceae bacterium]|nr:helix-turn-helix domain-containing protein [Oscillospiraceae bacterium]
MTTKLTDLTVTPASVGNQIALLRKGRGLTQQELGERIHVTFQAVSNWERGESLPDTALLPLLADALDTTTDGILCAGARAARFKGKRLAADMREGITCLARMETLLGRQNPVYRHAAEGLSAGLNTDAQAMLDDETLRECLVAEAVIQSMLAGYYFDLAEVRQTFRHEKWFLAVRDYAEKCGMG